MLNLTKFHFKIEAIGNIHLILFPPNLMEAFSNFQAVIIIVQVDKLIKDKREYIMSKYKIY